MRFLLALIALCGVLAGLALYKYGSLDPCRMLAQDMANDSVSGLEDTFGPDYEEQYDDVRESAARLTRLVTSQYSTGEGVDKLAERWF